MLSVRPNSDDQKFSKKAANPNEDTPGRETSGSREDRVVQGEKPLKVELTFELHGCC